MAPAAPMRAARHLWRWLAREWRDARRSWLDLRDTTSTPGDIELASLSAGQLKVAAGAAVTDSGAVRAVVASLFCEESLRRLVLYRGIVLGLLMLTEGLAFVYYSKVQKDFNTALEQKDVAGFYRGLRMTVLLMLLISPVIAMHEFMAGLLQMALRTAFTLRLAKLYLSSAGKGSPFPFYRLQLTSDVDNPDQRICDDTNGVVSFIFTTAQECLAAVIGAISFAVVLFHTAPLILAGILIYASAGTLVLGTGLGPALSFYASKITQQEAFLRYQLVRVHESAESVAFFRGGEAEWLRFWDAFNGLFWTIRRTIVVRTAMDAFNKSYAFATFAVVPLMVGPRYLRGEVEFGKLSQVSMAFSVVLGAFSLVMVKLASLAEFMVRVRRLYHLEALLCAPAPAVGCIVGSEELEPGGSVALRLKGVTLRTPPRAGGLQQALVDGLSVQLRGGQSLMIVGASGIGKSSLLRAVAGLWSDGSGAIEMQPGRKVLFLPQKPYMFLGSLREQLLYPNVARRNLRDEELVGVLQQVNLSYLLQHHALSDSRDWASLLSPGEQQRIGFARALVQQDLQLTLVDEGTSALDTANEARMYELLRRVSRSYVSVGHRQVLLRHHSHVLRLQRVAPVAPGRLPSAAAWELLPVADFERLRGTVAWDE